MLLIGAVYKVHNNCLFHHIANALDERLMSRVRRDIVVSVLNRGKLDNEAMCDAVLVAHEFPGLARALNQRGKKKRGRERGKERKRKTKNEKRERRKEKYKKTRRKEEKEKKEKRRRKKVGIGFTHLQPFRRVVLPSFERLDIGAVGGWMETCVFEGQEAVTSLRNMVSHPLGNKERRFCVGWEGVSGSGTRLRLRRVKPTAFTSSYLASGLN